MLYILQMNFQMFFSVYFFASDIINKDDRNEEEVLVV